MKIKNIVATGSMALGLIAGAASPALATTELVGGGQWEYGTGFFYSYSNYYHPDNCHSSTVINGADERDKDYAKKENWSTAKVDTTIYDNEAYYDNDTACPL